MKFLKDVKRGSEEDEATYTALEQQLLKEYPDHLPLLSARLTSLTSLPAGIGKPQVPLMEALHPHRILNDVTMTLCVCCTLLNSSYASTLITKPYPLFYLGLVPTPSRKSDGKT